LLQVLELRPDPGSNFRSLSRRLELSSSLNDWAREGCEKKDSAAADEAEGDPVA